VDFVRLACPSNGTPAMFQIIDSSVTHDFSDFPGGGMLIPPKPLYVAMASTNFSAAGEGYVWIYFTIKTLKDADYFELLETFRFFE
jgi:hypothetical protein